MNQPSTEEIYESLKTDTGQPFSDDTLKQIAHDIANVNFGPPMNEEEFNKWLDEL